MNPLQHAMQHAMFAPSQRVHFIGIGGIGMSGIAEILLTMGYPVSGSDLRTSPTTERLEKLGATIYVGHAAENAAATDVVVTSSAVARDNPEVLEARSRKTPVIPRAEMLAELMRLKYGIAVAGMHGKTTTTSMIAAVLAGGELDPTVVVGGRVDAMGSNARLGRSQYLVAEADESDRSFLRLSPIMAVVTNLDREHMDAYRDMMDIEDAFVQFMDGVPFYGAVTACADNPALKAILPRVTPRVYTYGESPDADFRLRMLRADTGCHAAFEVNTRGLVLGPFHLHVPGRHNILNATAAVTACSDNPALKAILPRVTPRVYTYGESPDADFRLRMLRADPGCHATFEVNTRGLVLGPFHLHVPGRHNILNATAAVAIGVQLGLDPQKIASGLRSFRGVDRRFQTKGQAGGVTVIDDYGHHPTEIKATLQAARECGYGRVLVLFQPHRYTRTRDLMDDFAGAFGDADAVQVLDIYAASEHPIEGITGETLAAAIRGAGGGRVAYAASVAEAVERLAADARDGDMILTLGAGSVSQAGPLLLEQLSRSL